MGKDSRERLGGQMLRLVPAFLAVSATAALSVHGILTVAKFANVLNAHHIAFLRTLAISTVSSVPGVRRVALGTIGDDATGVRCAGIYCGQAYF